MISGNDCSQSKTLIEVPLIRGLKISINIRQQCHLNQGIFCSIVVLFMLKCVTIAIIMHSTCTDLKVKQRRIKAKPVFSSEQSTVLCLDKCLCFLTVYSM